MTTTAPARSDRMTLVLASVNTTGQIGVPLGTIRPLLTRVLRQP